MEKPKLKKETILMVLISMLSAALNFINLNIEGTANSYYASAVRSMIQNLKNFFFVSFDPAGFVSIDKPPLGYWLQAISAKIFGFSGWSIILPQALAGVISVIVIYHIVKKSFGSAAGLISALCLAVTPVFVAVSRNNTVDNVLVLVLLLACWALLTAAEKGRLKYLILSMVLVGVGFNVKMLQAYLVLPAIYITYLFSTAIPFKKRMAHLAICTAILLVVSLSWAAIVDLTPASSRPYVDSSTNNTVMELIIGHNGLERLNLVTGSNNPGGMGNKGQMPGRPDGNMGSQSGAAQNQDGQGFAPNAAGGSNQGMPSNPPDGFSKGNGRSGDGMGPGGRGGADSMGLSGTFGGQTTPGIGRLFSRNVLSDQIVWFLALAIFGFAAASIREKLGFKLNNKKKQSLSLWFMWFLPEFVYFSFNTGTFHPYYLTMLAPPIAALTGIGITSMWEMYKEGGWKSWFLPVSLFANGLVQLLEMSYFASSSNTVKVLMVMMVVLCFGSCIVLSILNLTRKKDSTPEQIDAAPKKSKRNRLGMTLTALAMAGLLAAPTAGSSAVLFNKLNGSFPEAGLELLSNSQGIGQMMNNDNYNGNSKLIEFLEKNKTENQKYLLVVSDSNSAADIIINTGEAVMSLGGFLGNNNPLTLSQFKELVQKGEVRYMMTGGQGGGNSGSEIMNWVQQNGKAVSTSEYTGSNGSANTGDSSQRKMDNIGSGQLYDLKSCTDSSSAK